MLGVPQNALRKKGSYSYQGNPLGKNLLKERCYDIIIINKNHISTRLEGWTLSE